MGLDPAPRAKVASPVRTRLRPDAAPGTTCVPAGRANLVESAGGPFEFPPTRRMPEIGAAAGRSRWPIRPAEQCQAVPATHCRPEPGATTQHQPGPDTQRQPRPENSISPTQPTNTSPTQPTNTSPTQPTNTSPTQPTNTSQSGCAQSGPGVRPAPRLPVRACATTVRAMTRGIPPGWRLTLWCHSVGAEIDGPMPEIVAAENGRAEIASLPYRWSASAFKHNGARRERSPWLKGRKFATTTNHLGGISCGSTFAWRALVRFACTRIGTRRNRYPAGAARRDIDRLGLTERR
jgi:hypothetical protein